MATDIGYTLFSMFFYISIISIGMVIQRNYIKKHNLANNPLRGTIGIIAGPLMILYGAPIFAFLGALLTGYGISTLIFNYSKPKKTNIIT